MVNEAAAALMIPENHQRKFRSRGSRWCLGEIGSFIALYSLGTDGLSAAGITLGLAAAGTGVSLAVGGTLSSMVSGIFVLAAPVAALATGGVGVAAYLKQRYFTRKRNACTRRF